jgi:dipeptidyl-peptidase-3
MYGDAIDKITYWLEKAKSVAEEKNQGDALGLLTCTEAAHENAQRH